MSRTVARGPIRLAGLAGGLIAFAVTSAGCGYRDYLSPPPTTLPITVDTFPPATPPPVPAATTAAASPTTELATTSASTVPSVTAAVELSALQISDQHGGAVVQIHTDGCGYRASGSGFALDSSRVVTAAHVVDNTNHPIIQLRTGASAVGTVIGRDDNWDVAVVQLPEKFLTVTAGWGDVGAVREGATLTVIGYPDSPVPDAVGAYDVLPVTVRSLVAGGAFFEVSAGPDHGNSGGPAFDTSGEVVGLLVQARSTGTADYAYAVSSSVAVPLVDAMIAAPGAAEPVCPATVATPPPAAPQAPPAAPQTPSNPGARLGEEYRNTWVAQVSSLPLDVDLNEAEREFARFLALDPGFVPVLSGEWPATFDRADRIIILRGGFASRVDAESACARWGLAVPGDCLARFLQ